ncbi:MAG: hypothetical protein LBJ72_12635 [Dysgonamonadaceae bacterium]|jgi:hypothetical protein|nr:hypothetical protein [Dysgonamonadaceae bacterium]
MAYTGMQRSLTVIINKTLAGVQVEGYPRTYYGRNEFAINGVAYPAIDVEKMATMPVENYTTRLNAFELYVESLEPGLDINSDTIPGSEAYKENLTSCPIE